MSNIFSKLRDFVGFNEQVDYEYEYDEMGEGAYQNLYPQQSAPPPAEPPRDDRSRLRDRALVTSPGTALGTTTDLGSKMNSSASNVIGLPGAVSGVSEVVVMEPRSFEEMPQAIQALRQRKSVVLNLTVMDPDQAQRAVDFIAGGTYALDGHQERIGESIFLFTPNCVQVSNQGTPAGDAMQPQLRAPRPPAPSISGANWSEQNRIAQ
ncbi:MAG TPA: cell division protein SepF [Oscillatoriales cyanobacterium M59_W2019_021]|nr:MAG: cell division protein SepF [Cyanobacteria bacterium J055]HIK30270.1 cell division protein SepF [Oscillatoriales cyanobacterium M4454_W2019_049]HIK53415.1 cell division protein SepF [Oscillatoriales cyanobacterium M59_W2019_021]